MKTVYRLLLSSLIIFMFFAFKPNREVFLFSYFKGNGEDGLHLAYSYDGLKWEALKGDSSFLKPKISKDKLMRDPCIVRGHDGKFHMVWTVSWNERGIGYASSDDLIHWSEQQYIPVMEHEPGARNCWAPEILYDDKEEIYMIYWATTITGRFSAGDSCCESGYNHRVYYVTTKDFISFSETELLYDNDFSVIDAVIRKYNDKYYMILKDETKFPSPKKYLCIAFSDSLTGGYSKPGNQISPSGIWVEGPTLTEINNEYIVYFDMYRNHRMGAIKSNDLINWFNISDSVSFPQGTRHGSVFKVPESVLNNLINL